jgi:hypothetical protein
VRRWLLQITFSTPKSLSRDSAMGRTWRAREELLNMPVANRMRPVIDSAFQQSRGGYPWVHPGRGSRRAVDTTGREPIRAGRRPQQGSAIPPHKFPVRHSRLRFARERISYPTAILSDCIGIPSATGRVNRPNVEPRPSRGDCLLQIMRIEGGFDFPPIVILIGGQLERRAPPDRAHCTCGDGLELSVCRGLDHGR